MHGISADGKILKLCWQEDLVKQRLQHSLVPILVLTPTDSTNGDLPSTHSRRPRAEETHTWALSQLPNNLDKLLKDHRSAVKKPDVRVNPNHVTLKYHCHRGPAWRIDASKRRWLVQHVPFGCAPAQSSVEENVGCDWSVTIRYPSHHVPELCPITGKQLTGKWRDSISFQQYLLT